LGFGAPKTPPLKSFGDQKKKFGKKKVINPTPKKRHEHSLLRWLADAKGKVAQAILDINSA
jgi:hypothetical protein